MTSDLQIMYFTECVTETFLIILLFLCNGWLPVRYILSIIISIGHCNCYYNHVKCDTFTDKRKSQGTAIR